MESIKTKKGIGIGLGLIVLAMAGIAPNIYPAAMAGYGDMPFLSTWLLIPSIIIILAIFIIATMNQYLVLSRRIWVGVIAGILGTIGLEAIRILGFKMGWMPGDLPKLLGVLITDQFMQGPSTWSNFLGYAYHYWNGAAFGIIYAILLGRKSWWNGIMYGILIGTGFLLSPAVNAMGVGFMGSDLPGMIPVVYSAHIAFGAILGGLAHKWLLNPKWLFQVKETEG